MSSKLYVRGLFSNGLGVAILWGVSKLDLGFYAALAASIQVAVFLLHGLPRRSEKFYDLSGSATHFVLVAACLTKEAAMGHPRTPRQLTMALLSVVWLTRLGTFLFARIARDGKDGRFDSIKPNWLSFLGAWTLQAAWCVLTQLPVLLVNTQQPNDLAAAGSLVVAAAPLSAVDGVALLLWCVGFAFECTADLEKFTFRGKPENKGKFITEGVWRFCRHPNYFGEITMWFAMALAAAAAGFQASGSCATAWAFASPAFTALLLLKVSGVPLVEAAGELKWGQDAAYRAYVDGTSCVLPWFPASKAKAP